MLKLIDMKIFTIIWTVQCLPKININQNWESFTLLIFQSKHMLWVLKRTVSMRGSFENPKQMLKLMGKKIFTIIWTVQSLTSVNPNQNWQSFTFLISESKCVVVLKRTVSMRRFFWEPKSNVLNWWIKKYSIIVWHLDIIFNPYQNWGSFLQQLLWHCDRLHSQTRPFSPAALWVLRFCEDAKD